MATFKICLEENRIANIRPYCMPGRFSVLCWYWYLYSIQIIKHIFLSDQSYVSEVATIRNIIHDVTDIFTFFHGARAPSGPELPHYRGFTVTLI